MSAMASSEAVMNSSSGSKSKKGRKKKTASKLKSNGELPKLNGIKVDVEADVDDGDADEPETPTNGTVSEECRSDSIAATPSEQSASLVPDSTSSDHNEASPDEALTSQMGANGLLERSASMQETTDTDLRLEALSKDRDLLRQEVQDLRKSLEEIQGRHEEEISTVQDQLEETREEKVRAETQYRNLLGNVNRIKSQLGERLKADAEELSQARSQIEELEDQNRSLKESNGSHESVMLKLTEEAEQRSKELSSLRNRTNLSQQNWLKEREDLLSREAFAKEEFDAAKQAMQDWEVLAMEERSIRESLGDKVVELEEQLSTHKEAHERAASERDSQSLTVDGLQRALQEIQDARKVELRELVESSQAQIEDLRKQLQDVEKRAMQSESALETSRKELERALPFEKEVKEKNLLIGKLRHEAVILNDHLTKALRFLKKGKPEDNIDRQIVTNHFLHFLILDRSDPKKFQILQLIAALLNWTDEQREQAGLARPGASNTSLRTPLSPFHRAPSTGAISTDFFPDNSNSKESLAELWSDFLEREAEGSKTSRSPSMSSTPKT
ncbi:MAG: hypothetical protein M1827_002885 [Pycnora praestabilis]|nr:MAG: hypothetical protein M1827_002885 [Pycnora praestabilis]